MNCYCVYQLIQYSKTEKYVHREYLLVADHTQMKWLFFFLLNSMKPLNFVIVTNSYHHHHQLYHKSIKLSFKKYAVAGTHV